MFDRFYYGDYEVVSGFIVKYTSKYFPIKMNAEGEHAFDPNQSVVSAFSHQPMSTEPFGEMRYIDRVSWQCDALERYDDMRCTFSILLPSVQARIIRSGVAIWLTWRVFLLLFDSGWHISR